MRKEGGEVAQLNTPHLAGKDGGPHVRAQAGETFAELGPQ